MMKHKLLYTALVGAFAAQLSVPAPVFAQATPEKAPTEKVSESEEMEFEGFSISHEVKGENVSSTADTPDPLSLLNQLKADLQAQLEAHGKPLSIVTQVKPIVEEEIETRLQGLPMLTIMTEIAENGVGNSKFEIPKWNRTLPAEEDEHGELLLEWGGLAGKMTYTEQLTEPMIDMTLEPVNIEEKDNDSGLKIAIAKSTLIGQFDAEMFPVTMTFSLPQLTVTEESGMLLLDKLDVNALTNTVEVQGAEDEKLKLDLTEGTLKVGKIEFSEPEENLKLLLDTFALVGETTLTEGLVNYSLKSQLKQLILEGVDQEKLDISYQDDWAFTRLNAGAIARIQKQIRTLQQQRQRGSMSEDMMGMAMIGTLMQEIPFLLETSPQLAINQLKLNTQHGKLDAMASISIDGSKPINFQEMGAVIQAIKASADIRLDEGLLKKVLTMQITSEMEGEEIPEEQLNEMLAQQIKGFTEMNYLVKEGDVFTLKANMEGGKLMVNGQEMPLPM